MADGKWVLHRALVDRVLTGAGRAPAEARRKAFRNEGAEPLVRKVAERRPTEVSDRDLAAMKDAGRTDDEVFELVVCAAVGASARRYEAGLAALAEATGERTDAT